MILTSPQNTVKCGTDLKLLNRYLKTKEDIQLQTWRKRRKTMKSKSNRQPELDSMNTMKPCKILKLSSDLATRRTILTVKFKVKVREKFKLIIVQRKCSFSSRLQLHLKEQLNVEKLKSISRAMELTEPEIGVLVKMRISAYLSF